MNKTTVGSKVISFRNLQNFKLKKLNDLCKIAKTTTAKAVGPNWSAAYAIGLDITKNHIGLIYTDLSKQVLEHIRIYKSFTDTEEYYKEVTDTLKDFIQAYHIPEDKIVGVGISIPGIVDGDNNRIERSHVLNLYDVPGERFGKYIPYPTILINDANAAGRTEIDSDRIKNNIVYLSLSNSVGGSVIMGDIYSGNSWRSGEFGHMIVAEEEGTCYCGKKGCFDVCCSALRLAELADGKLENFFEGLEQQNAEYRKAWEKYLSYLAAMVGNLHMIFDCVDPYAQKLGEVSSISKKDGKLCAHAKDPISSGLALENFVPANYWSDYDGDVLLLGAGGSTLAMSVYFAQEKFKANVPKHIIIANRSEPRLESAKAILDGLHPQIKFEFVHNPTPEENDKTLASLKPHSLIVNATGLGKDAEGSPFTNSCQFPQDSLVWEINYRGDLLFKNQAEKQAAAKNLYVEDGWIYFIHGWTQVISEVFHIEIKGDLLENLSRIAKS